MRVGQGQGVVREEGREGEGDTDGLFNTSTSKRHRRTHTHMPCNSSISLLPAQVGVLMFSTIIVTVHFQVVLIEDQWTWIHHFSIWGSQLVW